MKKEKIIPFSNFLNEKIVYRDDKGQMYFDIQLLKEFYLDEYESFIEDSKSYLDNLKKLLMESLNINEFKIKNFDILHPISYLRVDHISKLVNVRGMITKTTKVVAIVIKQKFECNSCGATFIMEGDSEPKRCSCGRRSPFHLMESTLENLQEIELEEPQDELEGKQPQKIRIRLIGDLTDKDLSGILQPGNKVSILGYVEKIQTDKKKETIFEYRVNAIEIIPLDEKFSKEKINDEDLKQIIEISINNPLENLSRSLAPGIFGYNEIKKTLVLQMVGGVKKEKSNGDYSRERIHILLCGDPGLSKSRMAKNIHLRMPKSYYISGDETSKAGLIAIVDRDPLLNQWSLKAGALSRANDSLLIIDEMDKLGEEDRNALHTPMEIGEIIINKADIHTHLKAECSILGIANPKDGMFDLLGDRTITQQINLPAPLLSRFDIIFVMTDKIDEMTDNSIADFIYSQNDVQSEIPIELFRKYISYARKLKPKLLKENFDELSGFYHTIRKKSISQNSRMRGMPITPRHFEGLIRLAEASAKIRLSEKVEKEDLELAQNIFLESLFKLGLDRESGTLDMARLGMGRTLSKKRKAKLILEIIDNFFNEGRVDLVTDDVLKEICIEKGINKYEYDELIYELNKGGELLNTADGWKLPVRK